MSTATAPFNGVVALPVSDGATDSSSAFDSDSSTPIDARAIDSSVDASEEAGPRDASAVTDASIINGLVINPDAH